MPLFNILCSVHFLNTDTVYVGDWEGNLIKTTDGGVSWNVQHLDDYADIHIFFIDQNYSCILSSRKMYRTTNGGENWQFNSINTTRSINDFSFIDSSKGFVVGGFGSILMTTDGGVNSNYVNSPVTDFLYKVIFKNNLEGFIGGQYGTLLKTFDGGTNWQYNSLGEHTIFDISFLNSNKAVLVENGPDVFFTTDGGTTWINKTFDSWALIACNYLSNTNCMVMGSRGDIYKSTDQGNDWTIKVTGERNTLNDIAFIDSETGYAIGDAGTILKTTDRGQNWNKLNIFTNESLKNICFSDNLHGYVVGDYSTFLKTTDGGENWMIDSIPNITYLTSVFFLNNNVGWAAGLYNNKILKTTDGGITWVGQNINVPIINSLFIVDENTGFACGNNSYVPPTGIILKTTNGGNDWEVIKTIDHSNLKSIFFISSENGWVVGETTDQTLHTTNGGNDWTVHNFGGNDIYFWNSLNGIIVNNYSTYSDINLTSDGGNTWSLQPTVVEPGLCSAYSDQNGFWVVGLWGTILYADISVLPVNLTSFSAYTQNGKVFLNWTTTSELNSHRFEIERKTISMDLESSWILIGFKNGNGTTTKQNEYTFIDNISEINADVIEYRLKQIDYNGSYTYSQVVKIQTLPLSFSLSQNYPNPFNPTTKIKYQLPELSKIKLTVYDVLGREVKTLVNEEKPAGSYEVKFDGTDLPSGVYFCRIETSKFSDTKKFVLLK